MLPVASPLPVASAAASAAASVCRRWAAPSASAPALPPSFRAACGGAPPVGAAGCARGASALALAAAARTAAASRRARARAQASRQGRAAFAVGARAEEAGGAEAPSGTAAGTTRGPRVRFAPSPTGVLHVGGARTALFNWLFAKSQGGEMVLRVEDTDVARSTAESEAAILEGLRWCGLTWDEGPDVGGGHGPYRQSERITAGVYQEQLEKLIAGGHAYRCFLTAEELDEMRAEAERNEQAFVVDSPWARASEAEVQAMLDKGAPYVYRFRIPPDQEIIIDDLVVGEVIWNSDDLGGDFVIVRQNGMPMYNFGVVVDDSQMEISHVLRAQEHLMNTPRQVLIYEALGMAVPQFGHMPLILAPDRSKLSKRHGAVAVGDYQKQGYLASGMVNYLSQLGWNDGTNKEIYNVEELLESFKMERMSKVAAIFDTEKFQWVNGHHVRLLSDEEAQRLIGGELVRAGLLRDASSDFARSAALLLRDRISVLTEAPRELRSILAFDLEALLASELARPFLEDGSLRETAAAICDAHADGDLDALGEDPQALKSLASRVSEARGGVKKRALLVPLRFCLTASDHGPDMTRLFGLLRAADEGLLLEAASLARRVELLRELLPRPEAGGVAGPTKL